MSLGIVVAVVVMDNFDPQTPPPPGTPFKEKAKWHVKKKKLDMKIKAEALKTRIMMALNPAALAAAAKEAQALKKKFDEIDVDGSGELDEAELKVMLTKSTGVEPSDEEVAECMKSADSSGDGTVDFTEFCEIHRKIKAGEIECGAFKKAMEDFDALLDDIDLEEDEGNGDDKKEDEANEK